MLAPWSAAQITPAAMFASVPVPRASMTFTGRIEHAGQAPIAPSRFMAPAAVVATSVPCPWSSSAFPSPFTSSTPGRTRPARSAWPANTPVSTTAITTEGLPVPKSQARGRPSCCQGQGVAVYPGSAGTVSIDFNNASFQTMENILTFTAPFTIALNDGVSKARAEKMQIIGIYIYYLLQYCTLLLYD